MDGIYLGDQCANLKGYMPSKGRHKSTLNLHLIINIFIIIRKHLISHTFFIKNLINYD